ncbi:hypothetical protein DSO57_1023207 [Entomophthora muscae]|uniref:Uncharacterized protein n=1 Tax=Entomophthora muscae TaxID=34485 RepID=A0ACC2U1G5_9FUNG|nr:hypothetical protein DSO57_1023207 [Entomophthora muscae]
MPQSENAALRAQIADLTKQLTLFLSRDPGPCRKPRSQASRLLSLAQQRPPPPAHNAAPETEVSQQTPPSSDATSRTLGLTTHRKKLPTADRLQLVYVGSISPKPYDLGFDTRASSIANISFLGASTCELLIRLVPLATSNEDYEIDCPNLRILENFDAAKAADPKDLQRSSLPCRKHASPEVRKFFSRPSCKPVTASPYVIPRDNEDEIPLSATPTETDDQSDAQPSKETDDDEPTVPTETDTSPVPAETVNPQSTGPVETSSGNLQTHVPTVMPAQANTAVSTVPSIESESLSDIAPLQSNE